jgi:cyclophilin family peptidyl-prolyl cis-trans isomerase/HEAT repeat protein
MRAALPCVLVVVLSACAPALRSQEGSAPLAAALLRLEDRREHDVATLAAAAADPRPALRRGAALAAGRIRDPAGLPLLLELLADADTSVAATAAFALGQLGDTTAVAALAPLLERGSAVRDPTVAAEAAHALGKLPSATARSALAGLLATADPGAGALHPVVASTLYAVWRHPGPLPVEEVARWASHPDAGVRAAAAYALSRRPQAAATAALHSRAADGDPLVRAAVARSLGAAVADSAGIGRGAALELLRAMALTDGDRQVRINALRAMGGYDGVEVADVLGRIASGDEPYLALAALESLQRLGAGARPAGPVLARMAMDAAVPVSVRQAAVTALAVADPDAARDVATPLLESPSWRVRAAAARSLVITGEDGRLELIPLAMDPDGRVAAGVLDQLVTTLGDGVRLGATVFIEALRHEDPVVRASALAGLARTGRGGLLPLAFDAYARAGADTVNDAALAAVGAIAALAHQNQETWPSFFASFPRSDDSLIRLAVARALGDTLENPWGEALPIETGVTPEGYRAIVEDAFRRPLRRALLETSRGPIELELFHAEAPLTVRNFLALAETGYFDGQEWPRVVPNFVIQGGDPRGDTSGGPGYSIRDEINRRRYGRGTLGMALSGPDTGGSQWFITHAPQPHLDGTYTVFGRVTAGWEALDSILAGDHIVRIREVR